MMSSCYVATYNVACDMADVVADDMVDDLANDMETSGHSKMHCLLVRNKNNKIPVMMVASQLVEHVFEHQEKEKN